MGQGFAVSSCPIMWPQTGNLQEGGRKGAFDRSQKRPQSLSLSFCNFVVWNLILHSHWTILNVPDTPEPIGEEWHSLHPTFVCPVCVQVKDQAYGECDERIKSHLMPILGDVLFLLFTSWKRLFICDSKQKYQRIQILQQRFLYINRYYKNMYSLICSKDTNVSINFNFIYFH